MKKLVVLAAVLLAVAAPTFALVNGGWSTGDETGWTQWKAPWGAANWAVPAENGVPPPCGRAFFVNQQGSFGWFQRETNVVAGEQYQVLADWRGDIMTVGWAEVMFFAVPATATDAEIADLVDSGQPFTNIAYKKDSWGMNPPTAWSWESAALSAHPGGNGGYVTPGVGEVLVIGLKLGRSGSNASSWCEWDNITIVGIEPITTIDGAKKANVGMPVSLTGKPVTAVFVGDDGVGGFAPVGFAIEETDRFAGIRVLSNTSVNVGDVLDLEGAVATVDGERVITAGSVTVTGSDTAPAPFSISGIDVAGGAYGEQGAVLNDAGLNAYAVGMNNVGILVKISGEVTAVVQDDPFTPSYEDHFYVDDAYGDAIMGFETGLNDGSGNIGIKCRPRTGPFNIPDDMPAVGAYVDVLGVVGVRQVNGKNARYIWTVDWAAASFTTRTRNHVAKWSLLSLPSQPKFADPAIVFGSEVMPDPDKIDGRLYRWDAPTQSLGMYDMWAPDLFGAVNSSEGYWLNAAAAGTVSYTGYTESPALDRWISAPNGWKLMGNPFTSNTQWADWSATDGSAMKSIQDASQYGENWMQSIGYWWNDSTQSLSDLGLPDDFPQSEQLDSWYGYWVKTNKSLGLVAPSP